jgi:hypothetical protein
VVAAATPPIRQGFFVHAVHRPDVTGTDLKKPEFPSVGVPLPAFRVPQSSLSSYNAEGSTDPGMKVHAVECPPGGRGRLWACFVAPPSVAAS